MAPAPASSCACRRQPLFPWTVHDTYTPLSSYFEEDTAALASVFFPTPSRRRTDDLIVRVRSTCKRLFLIHRVHVSLHASHFLCARNCRVAEMGEQKSPTPDTLRLNVMSEKHEPLNRLNTNDIFIRTSAGQMSMVLLF